MSDYLPEAELPLRLSGDVLSSIFHRLPTKSLALCACVCKPWNAHIRSPSFLSAHLANAINPVPTPSSATTLNPPLLLLRLCRDSAEHYTSHRLTTALPLHSNIPAPPLLATPQNRYLRVAASAAGVVLLSDDILHFTHRYWLWNPSTRRIVRLPDPAYRRDTHGKHDCSVGLAYDPASGDFKVLRITRLLEETKKGRDPTRAEVFSLKSFAWRDVTEGAPAGYQLQHHAPQALANGYLHFAAWRRLMEMLTRRKVYEHVVLAFHVACGSFRRIKVPDAIKHDSSGSHAVFACDGMGVSSSSSRPSMTVGMFHRDWRHPERWEVWVMARYSDPASWVKVASVSDTDLPTPEPRSLHRRKEWVLTVPFPLFFFVDTGLLLVLLPDGRLAGADLGGAKPRVTPDLGLRGKPITFDIVDGIFSTCTTTCAVRYVETLALADATHGLVDLDAAAAEVAANQGAEDDDSGNIMEQVMERILTRARVLYRA